MSNNLAAINGDKRDHVFAIRMQAIYEKCLIGPLEGCRDQFMNSGEISRGFASNDHCIDLRRSHRYRTSGVRSSLSAPSVNLSTCSTLDFQDISYLKRLSDTGFMKSAELHHEWRR
jgi:hypothetical protein